ncbi:iron ABC transporter substrate-binding protein [Mycolicibacterium sp.]|uniref:iron ABC transporter substrate-binding protein n=1 Tax=Mycolicibacterium sp. TaxID=2320850 RepID=UPI0028A62B66|nr:iron ABC transporter substrate-binding protein [Mycolicibacterium sp.]
MVVLVAATTVAATVSCSGADQNELLIYNAQHESLTKEWIEAFTKETGIKVRYRQGGDTELGNQLIAEGAGSPADVFLTENSPAIAAVERAGLLADVDPETVGQVPTQYRPASNSWVGVAARSTVFVYNPAKLDAGQLPKSLLDLQTPGWRGRWGAPPAKADFQAIVAALLELRGRPATEQWLAGMKTNAVIYNDNIATLRAVNGGEVAGGVIYHYYWYRDQAKTKDMSANTRLHYFKNEDPGAFVSVSGGGVLASSKRSDEAQQFIRFVSGERGQQVLRDGTSFEYPVGSGVAANSALVPLEQLQAPAVNPSALDSAAVTELMTRAGLL